MIQKESQSATRPEMYEVGYAPEKKDGEEQKDGGSDATSYYDSEYESSEGEGEGEKENSQANEESKRAAARVGACEKLKEQWGEL